MYVCARAFCYMCGYGVHMWTGTNAHVCVCMHVKAQGWIKPLEQPQQKASKNGENTMTYLILFIEIQFYFKGTGFFTYLLEQQASQPSCQPGILSAWIHNWPNDEPGRRMADKQRDSTSSGCSCFPRSRAKPSYTAPRQTHLASSRQRLFRMLFSTCCLQTSGCFWHHQVSTRAQQFQRNTQI